MRRRTFRSKVSPLSPDLQPEQGAQADLPETVLSQTDEAKLLADKANSLGAQIVALMPSLESTIALIVTALVAAGTFGLTQERREVLVALPFPLIFVYTYLLQKNTELLSRAGHKRFLEEEHQRLTTRPILVEETHVAPASLHGHRRIGRTSLLLMNFLQLCLLGLTFYLAAKEAITHAAQIQVPFWFFTTCSSAMLLAAFTEHRRAFAKAYDAARQGLSGRAAGRTPLVSARARVRD